MEAALADPEVTRRTRAVMAIMAQPIPAAAVAAPEAAAKPADQVDPA